MAMECNNGYGMLQWLWNVTMAMVRKKALWNVTMAMECNNGYGT
jgi:hypothetical protein